MGGGKQTNGKTIMRLMVKFKKRCFYCGKKTKLVSFNDDGTQKNNKATIEHVYPKFDIRRYLSNKKVLACYKCNNEKGKKDNAAVFNNGEYREVFYRNDDQCIYNGLLITMLKSEDNSKYLS